MHNEDAVCQSRVIIFYRDIHKALNKALPFHLALPLNKALPFHLALPLNKATPIHQALPIHLALPISKALPLHKALSFLQQFSSSLILVGTK